MRFDDDLYLIFTSDALSYDEALNPIINTTQVFVGKCAVVTPCKSRTVTGEDGKSYVSSYQVICYRALTDIQKGDTVKVYKHNTGESDTLTVYAVDKQRRYLMLWL